MGFEPSKGEPDIWMRQNGDAYEYIGVYVDDLAIIAKDPREIVDVLEWKYKFKLKGTGPISFHLGMGFFHDEEGVLCLSPKHYIKWMISTYVTLFGVKTSVSEMLPSDAPKPLGKCVTLTHYYDANLFHDIVTGHSVTGILHLINKTPLDWYSKKQVTVETATYGSEFVAAHTCVDQIVDLHTTLRYLGVPL
jgi:Reverse transcriptase (RNA-dependent DNA polymerase)